MKPIKIDSGKPIPKTDRQSYPFDLMKSGESFFMAGAAGRRARMASYIWARRNGALFKSAALVEKGVKGVRVWRVE